MAKQPRPGNQSKSLLKLIEKYYADLADFERQHVLFEMGTRHAFHRLMADAAKPQHWTLIAEQEKKVSGKTIRPDGTFKDEMNLVRGYWEAKDTGDKLEAEIEKKRKAGYPFSNTIFEDTKTAVLFQNGQRILSVDMKSPDKLADLIQQFFRHIEPEIEEFEHAVDEFKARVPELAEGLKKKIEQAHRNNNKFKEAFGDFFELCQTSLNPNISQAAVDEMLIQHILTERLIREIFDNPEFVRRNVIAAEVEKVMLAMTSQSFDRNTYLKELDRFYVAIEHAARTMTDFSDKQYFLNTVYERFFQGYSVKLADTMGIVYTPQEIVDFMCASVAEVLEKEFGKKLWSDDVYIIDPCTGTGNFIVNLIRRIPKAKLEAVYKHRLFANEIMLLPYYIAALNIEHAYYEHIGTYEPFEGLCFADTLDLAEHAQNEFSFMTERNSQRVERQRQSPITVVIGNPPYSAKQSDENDNNKNRKYPALDLRVKDTYVRDSTASNRNAVSDAYIRFFRWAVDRLEGRAGIVAFVTNNGFLEGRAFDGFRKHMIDDFDRLYHFDLKGNARTKGERRRKEGGNVFNNQIRTGVGISILARSGKDIKPLASIYSVPDYGDSASKRQSLRSFGGISNVPWNNIVPDTMNSWVVPPNGAEFESYVPLGTKATKSGRRGDDSVFQSYSQGVKTNRDKHVYDFEVIKLQPRIVGLVEAYNAEVDRYRRTGNMAQIDDFVKYDMIKWSRDLKKDLSRGRYAEFSRTKLRTSMYRPFVRKALFLDRVLNEEIYIFPEYFPNARTEQENRVLIAGGYGRTAFAVLASAGIVDVNFYADPAQCFPFFVYNEDGTNRRENITDWALKQFRDHYKDKRIDKWAIFYYVYGVLHHPGYREKFADNLKRELPRIPFAPDFKAFTKAGKKLAALHLDYEQLKPWDLEFVETRGVPLSYRVDEKMRLSKDKLTLKVNPSLTLAGIPPAAFDYRLGNRSALEWVIDQYQVSTDKRSGITSDPNRDDDPEYIVRLVGQVIRVSIETVKIVNLLPAYC